MSGVERFDCLVPAAGRSERMAGGWKPLLPFGTATILGTVVANALACCARVILVTGWRGEELAVWAAGKRGVLVVSNPDWELGMFSSIRRGVELVETERFFIALGDMPLVGPACFRALARTPPADIVFPVFGGRRGHPVLVHARVRGSIRAADPARATMRALAARWQAGELAWTDDSIFNDIDTPADYAGVTREQSLP